MFVFDILQIPSGNIQICNWCIAPTCNHLDYGACLDWEKPWKCQDRSSISRQSFEPGTSRI